MIDWWVIVLVIVAVGLVLLTPFYVFLLGKWAGAGWASGVESHTRWMRRRRSER